MEEAEVFAKYIANGCGSDRFEGFELINRAVNLAGANGWAIQKHPITKQFKNVSAFFKGFGNNVEPIPVLADGEYLMTHKEMD